MDLRINENDIDRVELKQRPLALVKNVCTAANPLTRLSPEVMSDISFGNWANDRTGGQIHYRHKHLQL
jgi:hypothetical protein